MTHFIAIQYCYDYLVNQISIGLLLYSHLPTAILALLFGGFVLYKERRLQNITLFMVCFLFAVWCVLDLGSWFAFLGSQITMLTWSLTDLFTLLLFFFSYYFLYSFVEEKDLPIWQKIVSVVILLPTVVWTFFGTNLTAFDANLCEAVENNFVTNYPLYVQGFFIAVVILFAITRYFRTKDREKRRKVLFAGIGVAFFLLFFFFSLFLADLLVTYNIWQYAYNVEIYGLFGMPLLLFLLGYFIVKYKAFHIKVFGAQAFIATLLALIGSELFFASNLVNTILISITFVLSFIFGSFLVRSVRREIEAKERVEELAQQLDLKNVKLQELDKQKTEFVSFATHQLRSPLTAIKGNTSLILEGDLGPVPDPIRGIVQTVYTSIKTMINIVEDYLNVSRIELGTMKYDLVEMDFKELTKEVVEEQKPNIEAKGLTWSLSISDNESYMIKADPDKFKQVLMNTIDNSIKYTPSGSLSFSLEKAVTADGPNAGKPVIRFKVADTGVGIRPDVMPKLFQKFSRAPNAHEANIHGTGLGLFLAKEIITAHNGRIWAESAGEGKGSQFWVEVPEAK